MADDLDLTEAIEAAADALCDVIDAGIQPCRAHGRIHRDHNGRRFCDASRADVSGIVQAAAPIIERQVREQIAAEIEARIKPPSDRPIRDTEGALTAAITVALQQGMRSAARIARGES